MAGVWRIENPNWELLGLKIRRVSRRGKPSEDIAFGCHRHSEFAHHFSDPSSRREHDLSRLVGRTIGLDREMAAGLFPAEHLLVAVNLGTCRPSRDLPAR